MKDSIYDEDVQELKRVVYRGNRNYILLLASKQTINRLSGTCFRGENVSLAGNFKRWNSIHEMLEDDEVFKNLIYFLDRRHLNPPRESKLRFSFQYSIPIGWSSVSELSNFDEEDLVRKPINTRSKAFFVQNPTKKAPMTSTVTFLMDANFANKRNYVAVINSIYPGPDVGKLKGNMTNRTGMVWFDYQAQGSYNTFID